MKKIRVLFYMLLITPVTLLVTSCSDQTVQDDPNRVINPQTTWDKARFDDENFKFN